MKDCRFFLFPLLSIFLFVACNNQEEDDYVPSEIVVTEDQQNVNLKIGDTMLIYAIVHSSVGITFDLVYDEASFDKTEEIIWDNPDRNPLAFGGDRATLKIKLKAKKKGIFYVDAIHGFRGAIEASHRYTIKVE